MKILLSLCIIGLGHLAYAQNQDPQNFNFGLFNNGGGSNTGGAGPNNLNPSPTPLDSSGNPSTFGTSNNNLNTIGNPPLQNGFDQNNLNGQNGFNNPNQGFSNPNQGFNNPNQAFNNPNQGFNNPNPGFNNPNQGFNGGMGNQPGMNNGFGMNGQMGMNRQFGQPGRMGMNNQFGMNPNMQFRDPTRMGNFNGNNFNRMGFDDSQRNLLQPQPMSNFQQPQQRFPSGGPGPFFPSQPQFGPMGMQMGSTFGPQFASQFPGQPSFGLFQDPFMNMFAPSPLGRRQPSPFVLQPLDLSGSSPFPFDMALGVPGPMFAGSNFFTPLIGKK